MGKVIETPIFYMGNKVRLIKKGLIDIFPESIETFYDLFCGSGVVALNAQAQNKVLNDTDKNIVELINYFRATSPDVIIKQAQNNIEHYKLPTFSTDTRKYKGDREIFKRAYENARSDYNKYRTPELLYLLNIFSNSHMIRFNSKGEFNMPFGNGYFTDKLKAIIEENTYSEIETVNTKDFRDYQNRIFNKNDFVYLDPPYFNTIATYNENGGWTKKDEEDLYRFCEHLNNRGIKWGMSNVFENKNFVNDELKNWCERNNFQVYFFEEFTYCTCGKGNANTKEVFITNY